MDLNPERLPGNPRLQDTVMDFLDRQKRFIKKIVWPPGTEFECQRCGDCCEWNYFFMKSDQKLRDKLYGIEKYPHGGWFIFEGKVRIKVFEKTEEGLMEFNFMGLLPEDHIDFLEKTGRWHGYWVLKGEKIIIFNPRPCIHLEEDVSPATCLIYEDRPQVCRVYSCRRYPITP